MSDINEKLHELQESMQKLQLLKQLGAEKLVLEQEKEIFRIQNEIKIINDHKAIYPIDLLPKKCKFCTEKITEDERLICYENNFDTCDRKEPKSVKMFNLSAVKIVVKYFSFLALLLIFLLFTNIFVNYLDNKYVVFGLATVGMLTVFIMFRKPVKQLIEHL